MEFRNFRENETVVNALGAVLAVIGLALALAGARIETAEDVSGETLAWVNDRPVSSAQLARAKQRVAPDASRSLSEAQRDALVRLLIDEELLLQRAESLGVVQADPGVRKAIVRAAIDAIVADFLAEPPQARQLEQFYRQHKAVFERPARVSVEALRFANLEAAQQALDGAAQESAWAELAARPGAHPVRHLPATPMPAHMLRRYLGPAPAELALSLAPGETGEPVLGAGGAYLLRVTSLVPPHLPEYEEIAAIVRQEYLSRGREIALAEKLESLWEQGEVQLSFHVSGIDEFKELVMK